LDATVNLTAWNSLPTEYQEVFKTAAYESNISMLAKYDALNGAALKTLVAGGTELIAYSDEILTAANEATTTLLEESANSDATFKEVYESWKQFRDDIRSWNKVNELSFSQFTNK
ncbi:MAG: ABC transporter substrate-binding protein, partial [Phormidesmis sp.]